MLVIGKNPILEILKTTPKEFTKIILMKTLKPESKLKEIVKIADDNGIPKLFINRYEFANYFDRKNKSEGITQGVIGFIKDYQYSKLSDMLENIKDVKNPLILILDEITDPHNFGAIIRSAVCLGADGIVIPRHNSAEVNHTVIKTSSGAVKYIPIAKETNLINTIKYLKQNGYWIVGTDMKSDKTLFEIDLKMPTGLIIGSEGYGIRKNLISASDFLIRIPMTGKLDSLNASVSAGVILYEIFRQKNMS
ncbi:MAG: 23S rRNA (guanosine(2251)-2'-O)-methyltransferase RlmB [Ignavibacteria bacterium]|jgi:23S rRNA (guanosine2251-2'-O)-methyltransferase